MKHFYLLTITLLLSLSGFCQPGYWTPLSSGTSLSLLGVSAPDSKICYVSGGSGTILKTTDAGLTWNAQSSGTWNDLYSICFIDINTGIAAGNNGTLLRTDNGGFSWNLIPLGTGAHLRHVRFTDDTTVYVTGGISSSAGFIFRSTDAGISWTMLPVSAPNGIYSTFFTSMSTGYATEWTGNVYRTTDSGATWSPVPAAYSSSPSVVYFTNPVDGITCSSGGKISRSNDGGATWSVTFTTGHPDWLTGMDFMNGTTGYVVGGEVGPNTGTMVYTFDAGISWNVYHPSSSRLYGVDFHDEYVGYACGLNGTILRYVYHPPVATGVEENSGHSFSVYPNPSDEGFEVIAEDDNERQLELYDSSGRLVRSETFRGKTEVARGGLEAGYYLLKISEKGKVAATEKLVFR